MIRIFLVGYMGAGKTTIGKAFAKAYGLTFLDLDWYIEERYHKTVSELFAERGETGFREVERKVLHEAADFENVVIATGGGAPCFYDNMKFMNDLGMTVFLDVHPEVLFNRLRVATVGRPILRGKSDEELRVFIEERLQERVGFYSQAKYTFRADWLESRRQIKESVRRLGDLLGISSADRRFLPVEEGASEEKE